MSLLTRLERHVLKLIDPLIGCFNALVLVHLTRSSKPLLVSVSHYLSKVVRVHSVKDVKEEDIPAVDKVTEE